MLNVGEMVVGKGGGDEVENGNGWKREGGRRTRRKLKQRSRLGEEER